DSFSDLNELESNPDVDLAGDILFVVGTGTAYDVSHGVHNDQGMKLEDNQLLLGSGLSGTTLEDYLSSQGISVPAGSDALPAIGGTSPEITNTTGDVITVSNGNTIAGVTLDPVASAGIAGDGVDGLVIAFTIIITSGGSGDNEGIRLRTVSGTMTIRNVDIGSADGQTNSGTAIQIHGGTADIQFNDVDIDQDGGSLLEILNTAASTISFDDNSELNLAGSDEAAVTITGNNGGTVTLNSDGFSVDSTAAVTFNISGNEGLDTDTPVNDPPSFVLNTNEILWDEDAGPQIVRGFATDIAAGPDSESDQTLTFEITNHSDAAFFTALPTIDETGELTYQVADNVHGSVTFELALRDSGGTANGGIDLSARQTMTVTVNSVNDAPVLTPIVDSVIDEHATLTLDLSASDVDHSTDSLSWRLSDNAPAAASIDEANQLVWTPVESDGGGAFTFDVIVSDGMLEDSQAITVTVNELNEAPVFSSIADASVDEGSELAFSVSASDADLPQQTLTFSLAANAPDGASITDSGDFSWTPSESQGPGVFAFAILVSDGVTTSASETVTITVADVNNAPVLASIGNQSVNEHELLTFTATATDSDLPANTLTFSLGDNAPEGASITAGGVFEWTPGENQHGTHSIDVLVSDGLLSGSETIVVTVAETNEAPVLAAIGDQTLTEHAQHSFTATATDSDAPAHTLTFSLTGNVPTGAAISSTGDFSWTPTEDQHGTFVFNVVVSDGVNEASEAVSFTVEETNESPVLPAIANQQVNEHELLTFTATATDTDLPAQDLTFTLNNDPAGASITPAGVFTWTPGEDDGGSTFDFTISVTDGQTTVSSSSITVTVVEINDPPVLAAIGSQAINEQQELAFTATATDADLPTQSLTFRLGDDAPNSATISESGEFSWTPSEADGGTTFSFDVIVSDGALEDSQAITVTVNEVNDAPVFSPVADANVDEGSELAFTVSANDVDLPQQTLAFSLASNAPQGASISSSGDFSWTPSESQGPGVFEFAILASDGVATTTSETVTVTVADVNNAPVLASIGNQSTDEHELLTFIASATDSDLPANTLSFSLGDNAPTGASITDEGVFQWSPGETQDGNHNIEVIVSDGLLSDTETISVTVTETNEAPVLAAIGSQTLTEHVQHSFTATASDSDEPAQNLSFSLSGTVPTGAAITPTGEFSWTATEEQHGVFTFNVVVSDGISEAAEVVTFTVGETNEPPVLAAITNQQINENELLTFTAAATDSDLPAQDLTFTLNNAPAGASITPAGVFTWTPGENDGGGTFDFTVSVTDGQANVSSSSITVTVVETNDPPVVTTIGSQTIGEHRLLAFTASATDADLPAQSLTFSLGTNAPGGATITPEGQFTWTPTEADGGTNFTFDVIVNDGSLESRQQILITVDETNELPVLADVPDQSAFSGDLLAFNVTATDADLPLNTLTFSLDGNVPSGAQISDQGTFTWTPTESQVGDHTFDIVVRDGASDSTPVSQSLTVSVMDGRLAADSAAFLEFMTLFEPVTSEVTWQAQALLMLVQHESLQSTGGAYLKLPDSNSYQALDVTTIQLDHDDDLATPGVPTWEITGLFVPEFDENASDFGLSSHLNRVRGEWTILLDFDGDFGQQGEEPTQDAKVTFDVDPRDVVEPAAVTITAPSASVLVSHTVDVAWDIDGTAPEGSIVAVSVDKAIESEGDTDFYQGTFAAEDGSTTIASLPFANQLEATTLSIVTGQDYVTTPSLVSGFNGIRFEAETSFAEYSEPGYPIDTSFRASSSKFDSQEFRLEEPVNAAPVISSIADVYVLQGQSVSTQVSATDAEGSSLSYALINAPVNAQIDENGLISWTPSSSDFQITHDFKVEVSDGEKSSEESFRVIIGLPNEAPTFDIDESIVVAEDIGLRSIHGFARNLSPGTGSHEANQSLSFRVLQNSNPSLFYEQPSIDANGRLTFLAAPDAAGSAIVSVVLEDDGGVFFGGTDTSATQSFAIEVTSINDAPTFDIQVLAEAEALNTERVIPGFATNISVEPTDGSGQAVEFLMVSNTNTQLFSGQPHIAPDGTLRFTPGQFGTATLEVVAKDNGGTEHGGSDQSETRSFTISVIEPLLSLQVQARPSSFTYDSAPGTYVAAGRVGYKVVSGGEWEFHGIGNNERVHINVDHDGTSSGQFWDLHFDAATGSSLLSGRHENAQRYPFQGDGTGLSVSGNHRGNNTLSGHFEVHALSFDESGGIETFEADFTQYENQNLAHWMTGRIEFYADHHERVNESAGEEAKSLLISRTTIDIGSDLVVSLNSGDSQSLSLPATVTIPAGQTSVVMPIDVIDNELVDGDRDVLLTATSLVFDPISTTVHVIDDEVNTPPELAVTTDHTVTQGDALTFAATAVDGDLPAQTLVHSLTGGVPTGATITSDGQFSWTPSEEQVGSHTFDVIVSDGELTDSKTITVMVTRESADYDIAIDFIQATFDGEERLVVQLDVEVESDHTSEDTAILVQMPSETSFTQLDGDWGYAELLIEPSVGESSAEFFNRFVAELDGDVGFQVDLDGDGTIDESFTVTLDLSGVTSAAIPAAPQNLVPTEDAVIEAGTRSVDLTWDAVNGVDDLFTSINVFAPGEQDLFNSFPFVDSDTELSQTNQSFDGLPTGETLIAIVGTANDLSSRATGAGETSVSLVHANTSQFTIQSTTASVPAGDSSGSYAGGTGSIGGVVYDFEGVASPADFVAEYHATEFFDVWAYLLGEDEVNEVWGDFQTTHDQFMQIWDVRLVDGSGDVDFDDVELTFHYDDSLLGTSWQTASEVEDNLKVYHWDGTDWELQRLIERDPVNNTITIAADSFSAFVLGAAPTGASIASNYDGEVLVGLIEYREGDGAATQVAIFELTLDGDDAPVNANSQTYVKLPGASTYVSADSTYFEYDHDGQSETALYKQADYVLDVEQGDQSLTDFQASLRGTWTVYVDIDGDFDPASPSEESSDAKFTFDWDNSDLSGLPPTPTITSPGRGATVDGRDGVTLTWDLADGSTTGIETDVQIFSDADGLYYNEDDFTFAGQSAVSPSLPGDTTFDAEVIQVDPNAAFAGDVLFPDGFATLDLASLEDIFAQVHGIQFTTSEEPFAEFEVAIEQAHLPDGSIETFAYVDFELIDEDSWTNEMQIHLKRPGGDFEVQPTGWNSVGLEVDLGEGQTVAEFIASLEGDYVVGVDYDGTTDGNSAFDEQVTITLDLAGVDASSFPSIPTITSPSADAILPAGNRSVTIDWDSVAEADFYFAGVDDVFDDDFEPETTEISLDFLPTDEDLLGFVGAAEEHDRTTISEGSPAVDHVFFMTTYRGVNFRIASQLTDVPIGGSSGSHAGGVTTLGGLDYEFVGVHRDASLLADFFISDDYDHVSNLLGGENALNNYYGQVQIVGDAFQIWDVHLFDDADADVGFVHADLTLRYDPSQFGGDWSLLTPSQIEADVYAFQYDAATAQWEPLQLLDRDEANDTITVRATSAGPIVLGHDTTGAGVVADSGPIASVDFQIFHVVIDGETVFGAGLDLRTEDPRVQQATTIQFEGPPDNVAQVITGGWGWETVDYEPSDGQPLSDFLNSLESDYQLDYDFDGDGTFEESLLFNLDTEGLTLTDFADTPTVTAPVDGAVLDGSNRTPTLTWDAVTNADFMSVEFQAIEPDGIEAEPTISEAEVSAATTSFTSEVLLPTGSDYFAPVGAMRLLEDVPVQRGGT
ncbi:MAG: putative Ig domain-containing protein, partial [Planctomycetota bacterium]